MTRMSVSATKAAMFAILALEIACGSDSSGPSHIPTSIEANSSTYIVAPAGTAAGERPSVLVRDEHGDPMAHASVLFTITGGDGALRDSTVMTGADGIATVGNWRLGQTADINTVDAISPGLPSLTFTAKAGDPCKVLPVYTFGSTADGRLGLADCQVSDGSFVDFWTLTLPQADTYLLSESSTAFDSFLLLLTTDFHVIAQNDNATAGTQNSTIKAILPAGDFLIGANSLDPRETGAYTLTSATTTNPITNCERVYVVPGIITQQSLQTSDCAAGGFYWDEYTLFLKAGQSVTITMTSTVIDPYLELYDGRLGLVAWNDDADATTKNASVTYTAQSLGYFIIRALTTTTGTTGPYTLAIQ